MLNYGRAKQRYSKNREEKLSPALHLASAAEAGALVSHGAIQFTTYEELRRIMVDYKERKRKSESDSNLLVIRTRSQQRPSNEGIPRYMSSWHVVKETARRRISSLGKLSEEKVMSLKLYDPSPKTSISRFGSLSNLVD
ncbi:hypothetical protein QQP08_002278 [Theobroma cacao]|nr:hypothetical protein QQP08_002278 [Theobroma cacao]